MPAGPVDTVILPRRPGATSVREVRQVRVVQGDPGRDAQRHPPVDLPGPGDGRGVGLDQDVDGGQVAHWSVSFP